MKSSAEKKNHPVLREMITLGLVILAAWLLGQLFAPAIMKAIFL